MGLVTKKLLVCDRCGSSVPVREDATAFDVADGLDGWTRIAHDGFLCPDCARGYDLLVSRHKVELADYVSGR